VEFNVVFDAMLPSIINTELQGFSICFDSFDYFGSCVDFDFSTDCCSHNGSNFVGVFKSFGGRANSSPQQDCGVSLTQEL